MTLDDVYGADLESFPLEQDDWEEDLSLEWSEAEIGEIVKEIHPARLHGD